MNAHTAAEYHIFNCHYCGLASRETFKPHSSRCPRCHGLLHFRKPNASQKSWSYLIAAYILFFPANFLPIMETGSIFGEQLDTILSGIIYLWNSGSWILAALVFFASILVPLFKLLAMTYLLITAGTGGYASRLQRARLYRALEFIGRWSMLDIYVLTILCGLVQLKSLATIIPQMGAAAFGGVVVLTMLATMSFDPRLIWDKRPQ